MALSNDISVMKNPLNLHINFENNSDIHYTGEYLKGSISFNPIESTLVEVLSLNIYGYCEISWKYKDLRKRNDLNIYHKGTTRSIHEFRHDYWCYQKILMYNTEVHSSRTDRNIEFNIRIPSDCASSCEFEFGFIKYEMNIKCELKNEIVEYKQPLKILKVFAAIPKKPLIQMKANKKIQLQTTLSKTYHNPKDNLNIQLTLQNPSRTIISKIILNLMQYITYNAHYFHKHDEYLIQTKNLATHIIELNTNEATLEILPYTNILLDSTPSIHLRECLLLSIHYELQIKVVNENSVLLVQEIPINVKAFEQLEHKLTEEEHDLTTVEQNIEMCCENYKKHNNHAFKVIDNFLKYENDNWA